MPEPRSFLCKVETVFTFQECLFENFMVPSFYMHQCNKEHLLLCLQPLLLLLPLIAIQINLEFIPTHDTYFHFIASQYIQKSTSNIYTYIYIHISNLEKHPSTCLAFYLTVKFWRTNSLYVLRIILCVYKYMSPI